MRVTLCSPAHQSSQTIQPGTQRNQARNACHDPARDLPRHAGGTIPPDSDAGRHPPGSVSFVPSAAGYILAGECVRELISSKG